MRLEETTYPYMKDTVYQATLPNGLKVTLLPKEDFHEAYGVMSVGLGAVHTVFRPEGSPHFIRYPAGIAHFLEHKLFETEDGQDRLQEFSRLGASANAYTGLATTSYLFSTTEQVLPALSLLQRLVREPYFTDEAVEREKAIIGQEIEMYQDDMDNHLYMGILASLYPESPLADDIAGNRESIQDISATMLYEHVEHFYHPSNMSLFVLGRFDLEAVWQQIVHFQQAQIDDPWLSPACSPLVKQPIHSHQKESFEVGMPKLALGLRGNDSLEEGEQLHYKLCLTLLCSMLMGWTSQRYQHLYESGKIDASFSFHVEVSSSYHYLVVTGDTMEPIAVSTLLQKAIRTFEKDKDVSEEHLLLLKNELYGDFLQGFDSLEWIASQFVAYQADGGALFDVPACLEEIDLQAVLTVGRRFIGQCDMTDFIIFPK